MKRIINKINNSKILFTIYILIILLMFMFITNGLSGIIDGWFGILEPIYYILMRVLNLTYFGTELIIELFWIILIIPVILIFKNKYIFTQKQKGFFQSIKFAWPVIIFALLILVNGIFTVGIKNIDIYELLALLILTFFIGVFEEITCRGWIQNEFIERFGNNRKNILFSIFTSSFIFGIIHIINFFGGQSLIETLAQILGATIAGVTFGALYHKTKNIWSVIFLHALWDFAVFFPEITTSTTCITNNMTIENVSFIMSLFFLFSVLFQEIPEIATALMLLGKSDINESLPPENKIEYSKEEIKEEKNFKKIISICMAIFLIIYGLPIIFSIGDNSANNEGICPIYIEKDINEYTEKFIYYKSYDLEIKSGLSKYLLNFDINNNNHLSITKNNEIITLDYDDVDSLAVFENNGVYEIIILTYNDNFDTIIYHSRYLSANNVSEKEILNNLKNSFKQILLPNIIRYGIYTEKGDENQYPLFVSNIEKRYILYPDGTIFTY